MSGFEAKAGDLVSCDWDRDGTFRIAKVLASEADGVHLRVYAERFEQRPVAVPPNLTLGSIEDESFGVGHLALAWNEFVRWEPSLLEHGSVGDDELDGYAMWRDAADEGEAESWGQEPRWRAAWARFRERALRQR